MAPYMIILSISSIMLFYDVFRKEKSEFLMTELIIICIMVYIIIIASIRSGIGADFYSYSTMFDRVPRLGDGVISHAKSNHGEIGFHFLNSFLKTIGLDNPAYMFLLYAAIPVLLNYNSLKKYNQKYFYTAFFVYICLFFFGREMAQIRQGMSTAISLFSIRYIYQKELKRFIFFTGLASLFHISSVVFLPVYFIANREYKVWVYLLLFMIGILFSRFNLASLISRFDLFDIRGFGYLEGERYTGRISFFSTEFIRRLVPLILSILGYKRLRCASKYYVLIFNIYFLGFVLFVSLMSAHIYATRITVPYLFVEVIIYSYFLLVLRNRYLKLLYQVIILMGGLLFIIYLFVSRSYNYLPYKSIL